MGDVHNSFVNLVYKAIIVEFLISYYLYNADLKRVNLHVSSHRVVVGRDDVDGVVPNKLCDVDVPGLSRPYGFSNQMTEGKASQVFRVDSPTRPAKVAVAFKQMRWKTTLTTATLGVVCTYTAEVPRS